MICLSTNLAVQVDFETHSGIGDVVGRLPKRRWDCRRQRRIGRRQRRQCWVGRRQHGNPCHGRQFVDIDCADHHQPRWR